MNQESNVWESRDTWVRDHCCKGSVTTERRSVLQRITRPHLGLPVRSSKAGRNCLSQRWGQLQSIGMRRIILQHCGVPSATVYSILFIPKCTTVCCKQCSWVVSCCCRQRSYGYITIAVSSVVALWGGWQTKWRSDDADRWGTTSGESLACCDSWLGLQPQVQVKLWQLPELSCAYLCKGV